MYSGLGADTLNGLEKILEQYKGIKARELSPLVLAYVGDAVFEILARMYVVSK